MDTDNTAPTDTRLDDRDVTMMTRALEVAEAARTVAPPNPWVGCVINTCDGGVYEGATEEPGRRHAEIVALDAARAARADVRGATVYTTLEPCSHIGRTGPCTQALIDAQVARVVSALADPDPLVAGRGIDALSTAGIIVDIGCLASRAHEQLHAYLHHRTTGRPFVVLKIASTLDGRIAAADGSSQWITGDEARTETHRLRAQSGAIIVGARTVRTDDPSLTTRLVEGPSPRRIVLGTVVADAQVQPCEEYSGPIEDLLVRLGAQGVVQVLVEGGAQVAGAFHRAGFVDRYVFHLAPALMGSTDALAMMTGLDGTSMTDLWRGRIIGLRQLGSDVEIVIEPIRSSRLQAEETP